MRLLEFFIAITEQWVVTAHTHWLILLQRQFEDFRLQFA